MEEAFSYDVKVVIEKALVDFREVNCAVLKKGKEYYVSDVEEPSKKGEILEYKDKYLFGAKSSLHVIPAPIEAKQTARVRSLALSAFKALECAGVARIDFIISEDGKVYLNEINTIPGSLSFYLWEATGVSFNELVERLIAIAFERKRDSSFKTTSYKENIFNYSATASGAKGAKGAKR